MLYRPMSPQGGNLFSRSRDHKPQHEFGCVALAGRGVSFEDDSIKFRTQLPIKEKKWIQKILIIKKSDHVVERLGLHSYISGQ